MPSYGSASIGQAETFAPQFPIGRIDEDYEQMLNGHIGAAQAVGTATPNIAALGTPGVSKTSVIMAWAICVAGCALGTVGTYALGIFTPGAGGPHVAQADIPPNGFGWISLP